MRGTPLLLAGLICAALPAAPAAAPAVKAAPERTAAERASPEKTAPGKAPPASPQAAAACAPPAPPPASARPAKPPLPEKPACLDAKGGCPGWEAYSYNDAIKAYNLQAQAFRPIAETYLQKLNAYVKASAEYAQCEVDAMQR